MGDVLVIDRAALIEDGVVTNVIVIAAGDTAFLDSIASQWVIVTDLEPRPSIGWTYDGTTFTPPEVTE